MDLATAISATVKDSDYTFTLNAIYFWDPFSSSSSFHYALGTT